MVRRVLASVVMAVAPMVLVPAAVLAHGDHDVWAIARQLSAGPYTVSLWELYPDTGSAMTPHLIVMFDGRTAAPPAVEVHVSVNAAPFPMGSSATTASGYESSDGVVPGDVVRVSLSDGAGTWDLDPVVVPAPPATLLPIDQFLYGSILLTIATAWWLARRTTRAWRRPTGRHAGPLPAS